jgi:hypothetical protein
MNDADNPDLNPYESPREAEPLSTGQIVKRGIGVALVLLLTPPATVIAVFCCCSAQFWNHSYLGNWIVFGGPLVILAAMMTIAAVIELKAATKSSVSRSRIALFLLTPFVVGGAAWLGFFLAAMTYGLQIGMVTWIAFYSPPSLALLFMLWLAWQAGEPFHRTSKTAARKARP